MNFLKKFYLEIFYILLSVVIFIYVFFRVLNVGLTYDEAWTLKSFVPLKIIEIINFTKCDANNHILNTLSIKFFFFFGGENLLFSRLASLLSLVLYLLFSYKISRLLPVFAGILLFVLFVFNPFAIKLFYFYSCSYYFILYFLF